MYSLIIKGLYDYCIVLIVLGEKYRVNKMNKYVLGWPQPNGKVALLCRSGGSNPGPAFCQTRKEAILLRTKLANDPRGKLNKKAREIIRRLFIYMYVSDETIMWRPGDLWVYMDPRKLVLLEQARF